MVARPFLLLGRCHRRDLDRLRQTPGASRRTLGGCSMRGRL